jgi:hypothetical protein
MQNMRDRNLEIGCGLISKGDVHGKGKIIVAVFSFDYADGEERNWKDKAYHLSFHEWLEEGFGRDYRFGLISGGRDNSRSFDIASNAPILMRKFLRDLEFSAEAHECISAINVGFQSPVYPNVSHSREGRVFIRDSFPEFDKVTIRGFPEKTLKEYTTRKMRRTGTRTKCSPTVYYAECVGEELYALPLRVLKKHEKAVCLDRLD